MTNDIELVSTTNHLLTSAASSSTTNTSSLQTSSQEDLTNNPFDACKNGRLDLVKKLINPTNVNIKDKHGRKSTCLHFAAGFGRKDVCEYLLGECSADPSVKDEGGLEPIHNASSFGHCEVVQLLLNYKANVNALDNWNWSPLHEACLKSKLDVIMVLLRNGADLNTKNIDGKKAIEINKTDNDVRLILTGEYRKNEILEASRTGNEEKLIKLLTPLNVNCHASDGRKVLLLFLFNHIELRLKIILHSISSRLLYI